MHFNKLHTFYLSTVRGTEEALGMLRGQWRWSFQFPKKISLRMKEALQILDTEWDLSEEKLVNISLPVFLS